MFGHIFNLGNEDFLLSPVDILNLDRQDFATTHGYPLKASIRLVLLFESGARSLQAPERQCGYYCSGISLPVIQPAPFHCFVEETAR